MASQPTLKGGNLILRGIEVPDTVTPGASVQAQVTVSNGGLWVNPLDPDFCGSVGSGYETEVVFIGPTGDRQSETRCVKTTEVGTGDRTYSFTFTAPQSDGDYEVEAFMRLPGSGGRSSRVRGQFTVETGTTSSPEDAPDGSNWPWPSSDGGDGGGDGGNPSVFAWILNNQQQAAAVLLVLAFLYLAGPFAEVAANATEGR